MHPTIFYTKKLVKELYKERGISLFCDLHGHSRTHSAFVYGCKSLELPESTKIFPYILSKLNPFFSYDCSKFDVIINWYRFGIQKSKENTARIALYNELEYTPAIYTLESTFAGDADGKSYTPEVLKSIGRDLVKFIRFCGINIPFPLKYSDAQGSDKYLIEFNY